LTIRRFAEVLRSGSAIVCAAAADSIIPAAPLKAANPAITLTHLFITHPLAARLMVKGLLIGL
jgi:hypothetical protein